MNDVLKSLSRNSHGFLQRTTNRKTEYSPKHLEKIISDLYQICLQNDSTPKKAASSCDDPNYEKDSNCILPSQEKHEGSFKSLHLSHRKESLSCFTTPHLCRDNVSAKFPVETGNFNKSIYKGSLLPEAKDMSVQLFKPEGLGSVRRSGVEKKGPGLMQLGSKEKSKLQRIKKRINKMRVSPKGARTFKELFEFGVYKSFPKKTDLITDLVKILKDNIMFFQSKFNLYSSGTHFLRVILLKFSVFLFCRNDLSIFYGWLTKIWLHFFQ